MKEDRQELTPVMFDALAAAYHSRSAAIDAWRRWRAAFDIEGGFDEGMPPSLLPLMYRNLKRLGVEDPLMPRLKGVGRQAWLANRAFCRQIEEIVAPWLNRGVVPVILPPLDRLLDDGTVVVERDTARLAVHARDALPLLSLLLGDGWRCPNVRLPRRCREGFLLGARGLLLEREAPPALKLEWGLEPWFADPLEAVWSRCRDVRVGVLDMRRLDPTDAIEFEIRQPLGIGACSRAAAVLAAAERPGVDWERLGEALRRRPLDAAWVPVLDAIAPLLEASGAPAKLARDCIESQAGPGGKARVSLLSWGSRGLSAYRESLGVHAPLAIALKQLPGYLVGRWHLVGARHLSRRALEWVLRI